MTAPRKAKYLKERSLISLIGIDYAVLQESGFENRIKFYLTGFLVIVIMLLSFVSVFYGFELMFDMWHAEILLSSFFSLMFCNIYIFLIQTFSKETFPVKYKRIPFFNVTNLARCGFVLLIGFLLSQPLQIYYLRAELDANIATYKTQLMESIKASNARVFATELNDLYERKEGLARLNSESGAVEIQKIQLKINEINTIISDSNLRAFGKIEHANFFVKRIELSWKYDQAKLITLLVLLVFCLPLALIYSISNGSAYYTTKKAFEKGLVLKHHELFKQEYRKMFKDTPGDIQFYEYAANPPFNTQEKLTPTYADQKELFNDLMQ